MAKDNQGSIRPAADARKSMRIVYHDVKSKIMISGLNTGTTIALLKVIHK